MGEPVLRGYDRAALDAQYNNSAKVPDAHEFLARYVARSRAARADLRSRLGIPFGESPSELLDVFPAGSGPAPVHVFIHGGYWTRLTKDEFSFVAHGLVPRGAAVVVLSYALVPDVDMDELVRQCRAALAWTWKHAASFGGDAQRIHISGHSAGGHLVGMLMATDWPAFDRALPAQPIRGACGISGLYDLEPIRLCYLNDVLGLDEATACRNSPTRIPRRCDAPLLLAVGDREGPEYLRQSTELAAAWQRGGADPAVVVMPDLHHFSICLQLDDPDSPLSLALQDQMGLG